MYVASRARPTPSGDISRLFPLFYTLFARADAVIKALMTFSEKVTEQDLKGVQLNNMKSNQSFVEFYLVITLSKLINNRKRWLVEMV